MKDIGVLVIHGMGSQGRVAPPRTDTLSYSKDMHGRVGAFLGATMDRIAWREVFWADVLQSRQEAYLKAIKRRTDFDALRGFVMCNLSDAASYRPTSDQNDKTYELIHQRVDQTLADLADDVGPDAPILIVAHSLGGHIMSNFIYDQQAHHRRMGQGRFAAAVQNTQTVAGLITFGCNIPVFVFAYPAKDVMPIAFPGTALAPALRFKTWWYNLYDRDDVLGFPLKNIGPKYEALHDAKGLRDVPVNAGGFLTSWNPASHNAYWKDEDVYKPVGRFIQNLGHGVDATG
ncbi:hypothetical protein [uncultured Tateyamaria sp.]|uniref:hypothetical protein n=1 Tax=Tateyamaria sp. 1078 TaxID=3417464 RepID=UPI00262EF97F|nr:hypothetical protein [uncultured Tateyamaria sp.]